MDGIFRAELTSLGYMIRSDRTQCAPHQTALAFDPGLETGWAWVENDKDALKMRLLAAGTIDTRDKPAPFLHLFDTAREVLTTCCPGLVVLEQGFLPRGASDTRSAQLRGALKAAAEQYGSGWSEIHPMTARSLIGRGRGKSTDAQLRMLVCSFFGLPEKMRAGDKGRELVIPSHIIDAALVAWAAHLQRQEA